jgi:hypothetical protein
MVAFNGGRVWDESCFSWQVRAEREGKNGVAGEHNSLFFPCSLRVQGRRRLMVPFKTAPFASFSFFLTVHETTPFCPKHVVSFKRK